MTTELASLVVKLKMEDEEFRSRLSGLESRLVEFHGQLDDVGRSAQALFGGSPGTAETPARSTEASGLSTSNESADRDRSHRDRQQYQLDTQRNRLLSQMNATLVEISRRGQTPGPAVFR